MERVPRKEGKRPGKRFVLPLLLVVLLAAVAGGFLLLQKNPALPEAEPVQQHYLSRISEEDIQALLMAPQGKEAYLLVRTEEGMRLQGKEDMSLREDIVSDLLFAAGNVQADHVIGPETDVQGDKKDYGLENPSLQLVLTDEQGEETEILLGNLVPQTEEKQYFALCGGVLYTVLAEPVELLFHDAQYLRAFDQPRFQADLMDSIRVEGKETLLFTYTPDGFCMKEPFAYPVDKSKMDALLQNVERMAFEAYLGPAAQQDLAEMGLVQPEVTLTLTQAESILTGIGADGEQVSMNVAGKDHVLYLGKDIGDTAVYVLWEDGVYKASQFLFGFLKNLQAEAYLSRTPMNFSVDRLQRLTISTENTEAEYTIEMVEALTAENEIATDEYGQTLYDAAVKKNGQPADAEAFLRWYVQLNRLPVAGKVPDNQAFEAKEMGSLLLKTDALERRITFHSMDALHAVMAVDGEGHFYVEKANLSLLNECP